MGNDALRVVIVSGARPNFMKVAPVMKAMRIHPRFDPVLLHTGQHYDDEMSLQFFRDLGLVKPDVDLEVGSLSHAAQTAAVMTRFDIYLDDHPVDLVIVVGDVNSTIACALTAVKRGIRVAHIEAGLRSFDRRMPEEINRILTDAISHFLQYYRHCITLAFHQSFKTLAPFRLPTSKPPYGTSDDDEKHRSQ